LFHDLKRPTAKALPAILAGLKAKGFKVVHLRAKAPVVPVATLDAELQPLLAKVPARNLVPFYGPIPPPRAANGSDPSLSELAPAARLRLSDPDGAPDRQAATTQPLRRRGSGVRQRGTRRHAGTTAP
jgi:hypothetical protein